MSDRYDGCPEPAHNGNCDDWHPEARTGLVSAVDPYGLAQSA